MSMIVESGIVIIIICWLLMLIQSHRLVHLFVNKYPDVAKDKIPYAFERFADPGKILFFFKKENLPLFQTDKDIWKLRQQTKVLMILSITLPIVGAGLLVFAIFLQQPV